MADPWRGESRQLSHLATDDGKRVCDGKPWKPTQPPVSRRLYNADGKYEVRFCEDCRLSALRGGDPVNGWRHRAEKAEAEEADT